MEKADTDTNSDTHELADPQGNRHKEYKEHFSLIPLSYDLRCMRT